MVEVFGLFTNKFDRVYLKWSSNLVISGFICASVVNPIFCEIHEILKAN